MYRPLEELAQKLNLSVEEIKNSFQEKYKSLVELDDKEMSKLITAVLLRNPKAESEKIRINFIPVCTKVNLLSILCQSSIYF